MVEKPDSTPPEGPNATEAPNGTSELSAHFQIALEEDNVSTEDLLEADIWQSPRLTDDACRRQIGKEYYPKLRAALARKHEDAEIVVSSMAGIVLALGVGGPDEFEILVNRAVIRFSWNKPRTLLLEINELVDDVQRWISAADERHSLLVTLLGIASQVQATIARENVAALERGDGSTDPTDLMADDLGLIEPQIARARQRFLDDVQRAAQLRYAKGMARGALGLAALAIAMGIGFLYWDVGAINGVGLLAGGIGACVSVLQRMTSGTLVLNFQAVDRMLVTFGALRPFVGGVFGLVTFCVLEAGLVSAIVLPTEAGPELCFVAVFAFAAGFNERFFQDMLARASPGDSLENEDPAPELGARTHI